MRIQPIETFVAPPGGTVCTVGMFDGVHLGHSHILRTLANVASERRLAPVVVTFDRHPREVLGLIDNGFKLLSTTEERFAMLQSYGVKDVALVRFTPEVARLSACEFFDSCLKSSLNVKSLLVGYDNMFGNKQRNDFDNLLGLDSLEVVHADAVSCGDVEISSTQIRRALQNGEISQANAMLGYHYSVSGSVVHGNAVGRTIDFPTANIHLDAPMKAMPKEGVYAVWVDLDGVRYRAMANWGARPTLGDDSPSLEVHLLDFSGDLYGRSVRISFVSRIRNIVYFSSLDDLSNQLQDDRKAALDELK